MFSFGDLGFWALVLAATIVLLLLVRRWGNRQARTSRAATRRLRRGDAGTALELFVRAGDHFGAAQAAEQLGRPALAAEHWELAGDVDRALERYLEAGCLKEAGRIYARKHQYLRAAELLESSPDAAPHDLADLWENAFLDMVPSLGDTITGSELAAIQHAAERAAVAFERAGDLPRAAHYLEVGGRPKRAEPLRARVSPEAMIHLDLARNRLLERLGHSAQSASARAVSEAAQAAVPPSESNAVPRAAAGRDDAGEVEQPVPPHPADEDSAPAVPTAETMIPPPSVGETPVPPPSVVPAPVAPPPVVPTAVPPPPVSPPPSTDAAPTAATAPTREPDLRAVAERDRRWAFEDPSDLGTTAEMAPIKDIPISDQAKTVRIELPPELYELYQTSDTPLAGVVQQRTTLRMGKVSFDGTTAEDERWTAPGSPESPRDSATHVFSETALSSRAASATDGDSSDAGELVDVPDPLGGKPTRVRARSERYRLLEPLGRGRFTVAFRAHDQVLKRQVALKFLPVQATADAPRFERFRGEAQAIARLNHPNIVPVHEHGVLDGRAFANMDLVEGQTLREVLAAEPSGRLPVLDVLDLADGLLSALETAHRNALVHGDVSPGNVMRDVHGIARVLDFGLAVLAPAAVADPKFPATDLAYVAPEVRRGGEAVVRSDLFAAGVVLYRLLTGHLPFKDSDVSGTPPSTMLYSRVVPDALDQVILRCLRPEPSGRPETAEPLLRAVRLMQGQVRQHLVHHGLSPSAAHRVVEDSSVRGGLPADVRVLLKHYLRSDED